MPPSEARENRPSMQSIGEKLKVAREKKSLDIGQVQKQTRIHSSVLSALEEGRCDEIMTPTYVKSFLKEYTHFLGLDQNEILKEYSIAHPAQAEARQSFNVNKVEPESSADLSGIINFAKALAVFITIVLAVIFIWSKMSTNSRMSKYPAKPIVRPVEKPAKGRTPAPISNIRSIDRKAGTRSKASPSTESSLSKDKPFTMILKVNEPVWVEVTKDGLLQFKRFLQKGTVESFRAENKINIYVARAQAIEIVVNGRSLGSPGEGVIRNLEITRSGYKPR